MALDIIKLIFEDSKSLSVTVHRNGNKSLRHVVIHRVITNHAVEPNSHPKRIHFLEQ